MENIHPIFDRILDRNDKQGFLNQKSKVLWFTGLSGSGKSTIAAYLERKMFDAGYFIQLLDGDNIRSGINNNLGFSLEDRQENVRRIAEISKLFLNAGVICLNSFVSPTKEIRQMAKDIIGPEDFLEIYIEASLELCEERDVKGLYKKARAGEIKGFTGIDSPYEAPENPFLTINTGKHSVEESGEMLFQSILKHVQNK